MIFNGTFFLPATAGIICKLLMGDGGNHYLLWRIKKRTSLMKRPEECHDEALPQTMVVYAAAISSLDMLLFVRSLS